jgi:hypothetical protein
MAAVAPAFLHLVVIGAGPWRPVAKRSLRTSIGQFALRNLWTIMVINGLLVAGVWAAAAWFGFAGALLPIALLALTASLQGLVAWESYRQTYLGR